MILLRVRSTLQSRPRPLHSAHPDLLALLRLVENPRDQVAGFRISAAPPWGRAY
jgi:hypothetical protein